MTVETEIIRNELAAVVEVRVLFMYRGRDQGYVQDGALFNDDPSEAQCAQFGKVVSADEGFPFPVGRTVKLSEAEVRQAEEAVWTRS